MLQVVTLLIVTVVAAEPAATEADRGRAVGKIESCDFASPSLPPAFRPPKRFREGYQLFQAVGPLLPEETTVKGVVVLGQSQVGLTAEATKRLYAGLDQVYGSIAADALFRGVPSALPYCLTDKPPTRGHYFAYYPAEIAADTPVIVFLHGFGGNFLFYAYLLKEEFPKAVILLPSWGASWADGTMAYLDAMYKDVEQRKSIKVGKPCLMAISAGGPAGFRLYNEQPERFAAFVSIASAPPRAIVPALKPELRVLMVNGKEDAGFPIAGVQAIAAQIGQRLPQFELTILDGDHFFLLTKRAETFRAIKAFVAKHPAAARADGP
jgi:pimeloyl-ACP methyl ester carboxylesterase